MLLLRCFQRPNATCPYRSPWPQKVVGAQWDATCRENIGQPQDEIDDVVGGIAVLLIDNSPHLDGEIDPSGENEGWSECGTPDPTKGGIKMIEAARSGFEGRLRGEIEGTSSSTLSAAAATPRTHRITR